MEPSLGSQVLSTKRSEPAFAFTRSRPKDRPINTPGPKYDVVTGVGKQVVSDKATAPAVSFGSAKQRPEFNDSGKPGPGAYIAPSSLSQQALSTKLSQPSFSLSYRHRETARPVEMLGPGQCREDSAFGKQASTGHKTAAAFTIGRAERERSVSPSVPGPGAYGPPPTTIGEGPAIGFHFRHNFEPKPADVNGPARCTLPSSIGAQAVSTRRSAPGFSMTARPHDRPRESAPPPGSYETPASFGKQVLSRAASTPAFTMASRHVVPTSPIGPGPNIDAPSGVGEQVKSDYKSAPSFSFGTSTRPAPVNASQKAIPGPNTYALPSTLSNHTGHSLAGRVKFGAMVAGNMTVPGPASYSPVLEAVAKHAPAHGFAKAKPKGGADFVPGPGQYSDDNTVVYDNVLVQVGGPAYSLAGRTAYKLKSADVVGPGRCRSDAAVGKQVTSLRKNAPAAFMAQRLPPPKPATDVPGPGSYGEMKLAYAKSVPPPKKHNRRPKVVLE